MRFRLNGPGALTLILVATAFAGSFAAVAAAAHAHAASGFGARGHYDSAAGLLMPIRIVNSAYGGWWVLLIVWTTIAAASAIGWLITARLSAVAHARTQRSLFAAFIAAGIAFSFFGVTLSSDIYNYVALAHAYGIVGANPYVLFQPIAPGGDAVFAQAMRYLGNPPPADNYGPLWTLAAGLLARIEYPTSLAFQVWSHRLIAIVFALFAIAGIAYMLREVEVAQRIRRLGAFAFHPLVLFEVGVGGHNDIIMMAFAIWAYAIAADLPLLAGLALGFSISVKYVGVLVLPFVAVRASRKGIAGGFACVLIAAALVALFFRPFWTGPSTFYSVIGHGGVFGMSPGWMLASRFFERGLESVPAFPGVPALPFFGQPSWPRIIQLALTAAFLVVAIWSWLRYLRNGKLSELWRTITAFLWASPIIHPWYLEWLAPSVAAAGRWATFAWWFCALILLRYVLDTVAPAQVPIWLLFLLTVAFLAVPIVTAYKSPAAKT